MFAKDATARVLERKGDNKRHKCIHRFNYISEKSNKMGSPNVNLMGKKKKNSATLTQAEECKMARVCKAIYDAQREETVARSTTPHLHLSKWISSDGSAVLKSSP